MNTPNNCSKVNNQIVTITEEGDNNGQLVHSVKFVRTEKTMKDRIKGNYVKATKKVYYVTV